MVALERKYGISNEGFQQNITKRKLNQTRHSLYTHFLNYDRLSKQIKSITASELLYYKENLLVFVCACVEWVLCSRGF